MSLPMRPLLLAILLAFACTPKQGTPPASGPEALISAADNVLPVDPDITRGTLDNGLTYFIEHNTEPSGWAEFRLILHAGSLFEDDDQLGLAHVVEHMAFNGTEHFTGNDLIDYIQSIGASFGAHLNAHTSFDETVYKLRVPTDQPEILEQTLQVLVDWAQGLTFDPDEIERERGVVLEEWRGRLGAGERLAKAYRPLMYGTRHTARFPIGTEESLKTFEQEALIRFYRDWYRPNLMAVAVAGDIDVASMETQIKERFSVLKNPDEPRPRVDYEPERHEEMQVLIQSDPELTTSTAALSAHMDWSWGKTEADYAQRMHESLSVSILNERLGEISRQPTPPFRSARFGRSAFTPRTSNQSLRVTAREDDVKQGLAVAYTELERARRHGFTEAELTRAKARHLQGTEAWYSERDKTDSRSHVQEITRHFLTGETMPGTELEYALTTKIVPLVTIEDLNSQAKQWLTSPSQLLHVRMPEKEGLTLPEESALRALITEVQSAEIDAPAADEAPPALTDTTPTPGTIASTRTIESIGVTEWTLSNGIRVVAKPTSFKNNEIRFSASSWGGHSLASDADYVAATTAISIAGKSGLGDLSQSQLRKALAGKTVSVRPFISETQQGVSGSSSVAELETALQLVHLHLTAPRFDEDAYIRERQSRTERLQNRLANPSSVYSDKRASVTWSDHKRRVSWTVEDLEGMSLETSKNFYAGRFHNPGDLTFVIVGTFDLETLKNPVLTWLASLPSTDKGDVWKDVGARRPSGIHKEVVHAGHEPKASVQITFHGSFEKNRANDHIRSSLVSVMRTRLREVLREDKSGTYGVGVSSSAGWIPEEHYTLTVRFGCEPSRVDELTNALFDELKSLIAEPVDATYIAHIQEQQRRKHDERLEKNSFWLNGLSWRYRYDKDPTDILAHSEYVDALTPEQVHAMAKQLIDLKNYTHFVLLPEGDSK